MKTNVSCTSPGASNPFVNLNAGDGDGDGEFDDFLFPRQSWFALLEFLDPTSTAITYNTRVLSVTPAP